MGLDGKVAIVTGGGQGIGREICLRLAAQGAAVVVTDKGGKTAAPVCREIERAGGRAAPFTMDVRSAREVEDLGAHAQATYGSIDILVNNAGVSAQEHFLDTSRETWDDLLAINLTGTFLCAQAAARRMAETGWGRIINISTHSGVLGSAGRAAYAASKGGVLSLTRVMAIDLAEYGITVNAIAPGPIETPRSARAQSPERRESWIRATSTPLRRFGTPADVAGAAAFLASEDASYITGATIPVDGGFTAAGILIDIPRRS